MWPQLASAALVLVKSAVSGPVYCALLCNSVQGTSGFRRLHWLPYLWASTSHFLSSNALQLLIPTQSHGGSMTAAPPLSLTVWSMLWESPFPSKLASKDLQDNAQSDLYAFTWQQQLHDAFVKTCRGPNRCSLCNYTFLYPTNNGACLFNIVPQSRLIFQGKLNNERAAVVCADWCFSRTVCCCPPAPQEQAEQWEQTLSQPPTVQGHFAWSYSWYPILFTMMIHFIW